MSRKHWFSLPDPESFHSPASLLFPLLQILNKVGIVSSCAQKDLIARGDISLRLHKRKDDSLSITISISMTFIWIILIIATVIEYQTVYRSAYYEHISNVLNSMGTRTACSIYHYTAIGGIVTGTSIQLKSVCGNIWMNELCSCSLPYLLNQGNCME